MPLRLAIRGSDTLIHIRPLRRRALVILTVATFGWLVVATPFLLFDAVPFRLLVTDDRGQPVSGATVAVGGTTALTDVSGVVELAWARQALDITITAPGHHPTDLVVGEEPEADLAATLIARVLSGRVADPTGKPVGGVTVWIGDRVGVSAGDGTFSLRAVEPGTVGVGRPAWAGAEAGWDGSHQPLEVVVSPLVVKALHITGPAAADEGLWAGFLDLVRTTELNGLMVDLKDETGKVFYETSVPLAEEVGAVASSFDLEALVAEVEAEDIYLIGRIVAFQDPRLTKKRPELSVWNTATGAPYENHDQYFVDPTDPVARDYALDLAAEACSLGVDEIQFDYVRFPDGFPPTAVFDGGSSEEVRIATIAGFLGDASDRLHPLGCAVAADVFGFTASIENDGGIGQHWDEVTGVVDVVSPMLYPSHYYPGWFDFEVPNDHPGPVVSRALDDGLGRVTSQVIVRPWLQDFWYTPDQVRAQIDEVEERGLGWMLWNAASRFSVEALRPAG